MNWLLDVMPHITGVVCYNTCWPSGPLGRRRPEAGMCLNAYQ